MNMLFRLTTFFSTELFNIVPACEECNGKKKKRLLSEDIFIKVLERNANSGWKLEGYTREWYQNLYGKCVVEYHGKREYFTSNNS